MARRNVIPNPRPVGLEHWTRYNVQATEVDFSISGGKLHYEANVTATGAYAGMVTGDLGEVAVRGGERYAFVIHDVDVVSKPAGGLLRIVLSWKNLAGGPVLDNTFGVPLPGAGSYDQDDLTVIAEAPEAANQVVLQLVYISLPGAIDALGALEFSAGQFMLEPLGKPPTVAPFSRINLVTEPSLEYGEVGWIDHSVDFPGMDFADWGRSNAWAHGDGDWSMYSKSIAGETFYTPTIAGVAGSYLPLSDHFCQPGDMFTLEAWVNNLVPIGGPTSPGIFLEMFFYFYDGDPAHTVETAHLNGSTIFTPMAAGEHFLTLTGIAPANTTFVNVLVVGATNVPHDTIEFYTDQAMVIKGPKALDYFDGDTLGAAWLGVPGKSASMKPGRDVRLPGGYIDGDEPHCQWEGEPYDSISSTKIKPALRIGGPATVSTLDLVQATKNQW